METYAKRITEYQLKKVKSDIPAAKIVSSHDAATYARQFYFDDIEIYESMFLMLLNRANNVVGYVKISQGGTAGTIVDMKMLANYAINSLCHSIILVHNHPSGNINPSQNDVDLTKKAKEGLKLFDIAVLDHIIITKESHYSLAENGII